MARKKPSVAALVQARLGVPRSSFGPTLTSLVAMRARSMGDYLEIGPPAWDWPVAAQLETQYGFVVVGKTGNGFFGPVRDRIRTSVSAAPWLYADRQMLPAEKVGTLAQLLSLWCFVPDFFTLHDQSADDLAGLHTEFFELNPSMKRAVQPVLALPGVTKLTASSAAKLVAKVGGLLLPEPDPPALRDPVTEATGQDIEVTKQRIREIEAKALAKLRGMRS